MTGLQLTKLAIFMCATTLAPYLFGSLVLGTNKKTTYISPWKALVFGYVLIWGIMEIVVIPLIYMDVDFHIFAWICSAIFAIGIMISVGFYVRKMGRGFAEIWKARTKDAWLIGIVIVLVVLQALKVMQSYVGDMDDAFYVAQAETAISTDSLMRYDPYTGDVYEVLPSRYVLSPFPLFIAYLSWITQISPVAIAHTMLPFVLIIVCYVGYYVIAKQIFPDSIQKRSLFLLFVYLLLTYSNYSVYSQGVFMLTRIWQGKAVLTAFLLPLLVYWGIRLGMDRMEKEDYVLLLATMFASCFVSSMGIMLAAIMLGICGIVNFIKDKKIKKMLLTLLCCAPNVVYALIYIIIR